MPDLHFSEEEAALYIAGALNLDRRAEFEKRLAESAELRALVRELEEGAVALAMAAPRLRAPSSVWQRIEAVVAREGKPKAAITESWLGWWRSGWAAATACVLASLLYALWVHRPGRSEASLPSDVSENHSQPVTPTIGSFPAENKNVARAPLQATPTVTNTFTNSVADERQIRAFQWQIANLENQMARMVQSLAQQQALLAEPGRIKFFMLPQPSNSSPNALLGRLAPEVQRALFLALARELGWQAISEEQTGNSASSGQTNRTGVDFVDLRTGTNAAPNPPRLPEPELQITSPSTPTPTLPTTPSGGPIPGFVSGDNLVVAIDSSIAPAGSHLSFWSGTDNQPQQLIGTATLGNNPAVVTVPIATASAAGSGLNLSVVASTPGGSSNVIGYFPPPTNITHP